MVGNLLDVSFTFNQGSLGIGLEKLNSDVHDYIMSELRAASSRGEAEMKLRAPWTETGMTNRWGRRSTGLARSGLWSEASSEHGMYKITMGQGVDYGIYLEKSNGGRYQIIMPVLVETSRAFMESLAGMLEHLHEPAPISAVAPGVGIQQGTSQGAAERIQGVRGAAEKAPHKIKTYFRNERGQFTRYKGVTVGTGATSTTRPTKKTKRR